MKLLLLTAMAWAQEHGGDLAHELHESVEIPWSTLTVQLFNFAFLFLLLGYFLRKSVKAHFTQRSTTYRELVDRAENARREAEQSHNVIKERLAKLESSAEQSVVQARSEAEDLRNRMLSEAKVLAQKMEEDAKRTTAVELEKAKLELRKELLTKSLAASQENLKKNLSTVEQKKLQNEFAEKIELVGG